MPGTYDDFFEALGQRESGGDYTLVRPDNGFAGKYQFGEAVLIDAEYYTYDGTDVNDWIGTWKGKDGVTSFSDFLSMPQAQENAIREIMDILWSRIEFYGDDIYVGQVLDGLTITSSGVLGGGHLGGIGGIKNYLESGGDINPSDVNGTKISDYIEEFANYNTPFSADLSGNDIVNGGSGSDYLVGGAGDDYLYGKQDDDTLTGDTGNDHVYGGTGNDNYRYGGGNPLDDGNEILDEEASNDPNDRIELLGQSYIPSQNEVEFSLNDDRSDLIIEFPTYGGAIRSITIVDMDDPAAQIEWLDLYDHFPNRIGDPIYLPDEYTKALNNVPPPALAIAAADADKAEGSTGTTPFTFTVTRSGDVSGPVSTSWAVSVNQSPSASPADFAGGVFPSGTVSFAPGDVSKTITVQVAADAVYESGGLAELFAVTLSAPTGGATINPLQATASGSIRNDDSPPINVINGTSGNDTRNGTGGADRINGLAGNDTLNGNGGGDEIYGGAGNDRLNGNAGNDVLVGGTGKDTQTGGTEADRFDFNSIAEAGLGTTRDVILDFSSSQIDKIDLSTIDARAGVSGNQAFSFIGTSAFSTNANGQLRANDLGSTVILQGSTDADRAAEFEIEVRNFTGTFASGDFIV